jgi:hypothetical protein
MWILFATQNDLQEDMMSKGNFKNKAFLLTTVPFLSLSYQTTRWEIELYMILGNNCYDLNVIKKKEKIIYII